MFWKIAKNIYLGHKSKKKNCKKMRHFAKYVGEVCDTVSNLLGTHTLVRTCPHAAGSHHGDDDDDDGDDGFLRELRR